MRVRTFAILPPLSALAALAMTMGLLLSETASALTRQDLARRYRAAPIHASPSLYDGDDRMDVNALEMVVTNQGSFAFDYEYNIPYGRAGLLYPRGTSQNAIFAGGLWVGAVANAARRVAVAEYHYGNPGFEYVPGPMSGGFYQDDQLPFRNYRIEKGNTTSEDYLSWPISQGAPTDSLGLPLVLGDATLWSVYNDAEPFAHFSLPGGTAVLGLEVHHTTFAFSRPGPLGRVIFLKYKLINRGYNDLESTYVALWCDPDIGGALDDLAGCDTTRALAYGYNGGDFDDQYGASPPAAAYTLLQGPIVSAIGGAADTLGMTAVTSYSLFEDPVSGLETFNLMKGLQRDGTPMHVNNDSLEPVTTHFASGDPVAGTGWLDGNPYDRRFMISSGPFTMAIGDSQEIVAAILMGQGPDRLASVADLRDVHAAAVEAYRAGFLVPEEPTTAIAMYLLESEVSSERVSLRWYVPDAAGLIGIVERIDSGAEWRQVSDPLAPEGHVIRFEDTAVSPGARYGYRLLVRNGVEQDRSAETWVTIPSAPAAPGALTLRPGYPNPTSAFSRWSYYLPREGRARLAVWDAQGRLVRVIFEGDQPIGWRDANWDGRDQAGREVATGIYFARLDTAERAVVRKIVLAR